VIAWRLARAVDRRSAFSGIGSFRYGGRWNSAGRYCVYVSRSISTAALEILAHAGTPRALPLDEIVIKVVIPDSLRASRVELEALPDDWQTADHPACRQIGDAWLESARTAILDVPSAIVPQERNLILNPLHPDFPEIDTSDRGIRFRWDPRLISFLKA
jgi:RES domain-containing protein